MHSHFAEGDSTGVSTRRQVHDHGPHPAVYDLPIDSVKMDMMHRQPGAVMWGLGGALESIRELTQWPSRGPHGPPSRTRITIGCWALSGHPGGRLYRENTSDFVIQNFRTFFGLQGGLACLKATARSTSFCTQQPVAFWGILPAGLPPAGSHLRGQQRYRLSFRPLSQCSSARTNRRTIT